MRGRCAGPLELGGGGRRTDPSVRGPLPTLNKRRLTGLSALSCSVEASGQRTTTTFSSLTAAGRGFLFARKKATPTPRARPIVPPTTVLRTIRGEDGLSGGAAGSTTSATPEPPEAGSPRAEISA